MQIHKVCSTAVPSNVLFTFCASIRTYVSAAFAASLASKQRVWRLAVPNCRTLIWGSGGSNCSKDMSSNGRAKVVSTLDDIPMIHFYTAIFNQPNKQRAKSGLSFAYCVAGGAHLLESAVQNTEHWKQSCKRLIERQSGRAEIATW